ncbi:MAG TPA: DUF1028 domain-containing protein, partial [Longimicrobiales bacterium]|nr:DUF1028 domain-containing protein [Longimicrobiales bacterium]
VQGARMSPSRSPAPRSRSGGAALLLLGLAAPAAAQEPVAWGAAGEAPHFHTFSIVAVDAVTGESGVAVTTRVPCVGNGVPWVRAGVGAVATQAYTRTEYGPELLELLAQGMTPEAALARALAADTGAERRQVGVVGLSGASAQHTGGGTTAWAGHRSGPGYATQGNLLVGPEVLAAVAERFEATAGTGRHLADRLIAALGAGQAAGGDARKGRLQSAAVVVADPREGVSRRPDGITVSINVCENPAPVAELRRIYDAISQTLGYRTLELPSGADVWQLRIILHALGHYRPGAETLERGRDAFVYTQELVDAVDAFRAAQGLSTPRLGSPPGLVDAQTVELLGRELERQGQAEAVRQRILEITQVRR